MVYGNSFWTCFSHEEITNVGGKGSGELDILSPVDFCKAFNPVCLTFCKRASDTMSGKFTLIGLKPDWHSSRCRYCRTTIRFFSDFLSPEPGLGVGRSY